MRTAAALVLLGIVALLAGSATPAFARDLPPAPSTYVLDEPGWLSASEQARLSRQLLDYEKETSNQILVAIFDSLGDEELGDFSQRLAQAWHIGQKDRNNGILLAIYVAERKSDIEVGYGLEGVVTDAVSNEIRTGILRPALREGRQAEGVFAATSALMDAARGEFKGTGHAGSEPSPWKKLLPIIIFFIVISILQSRLGAAGPFIMGAPGFGRAGRLYRRGGFFGGGFGGGGFGGFGGGGGGFSGGGGSFGGGGARGGW